MLYRARNKNLPAPKTTGVWEILANNRILFLEGYLDWIPTPYSALVTKANLICLANESKDPIKLKIKSPGGIISAGKMLYRTIAMLNPTVPIWTIGYDCESMAALILASGKKGHRYIHPFGRVLLHAPIMTGTMSVREADQLKREAEMIIKFLVNTCQMSKEKEEELYKVIMVNNLDWWFTPEEAVEFGIVDKIIDPESDLYFELFGNLKIPQFEDQK